MNYKSKLIKLAIFTAGALVGFLTAKKIYEGYYAAIAQEEIDSIKARFVVPETLNDLDDTSNPVGNGMTDEEYDAICEKRHNDNPLTRSSIKNNPYEQAKINYNLGGLTPGDLDEEETDIGEEEEFDEDNPTDAAGMDEEDMAMPKVDRTQPYIISSDEFLEGNDLRDKVSLYYYQVDDVLCDERDEVIDDIDNTVGYDALAALDMQTSVWVRNEPLFIDYEILLVKKAYSEAVRGIDPDPPNLSPREQYMLRKKRSDQHGK